MQHDLGKDDLEVVGDMYVVEKKRKIASNDGTCSIL